MEKGSINTPWPGASLLSCPRLRRGLPASVQRFSQLACYRSLRERKTGSFRPQLPGREHPCFPVLDTVEDRLPLSNDFPNLPAIAPFGRGKLEVSGHNSVAGSIPAFLSSTPERTACLCPAISPTCLIPLPSGEENWKFPATTPWPGASLLSCPRHRRRPPASVQRFSQPACYRSLRERKTGSFRPQLPGREHPCFPVLDSGEDRPPLSNDFPNLPDTAPYGRGKLEVSGHPNRQ